MTSEVWVPEPADEVDAVRRIFEMYAKTEMSVVDVARAARALGIRAQSGRPITEWMLYSLLRCEAFVGHFVWRRAEQKRRRDQGDPRIRRKENALNPRTMQRCLRKICRAHFDWILVVRLTTDGRTHDSILVERRDYFSLDKWLPESQGAGWNWNGKQQQITDLSARYKIGAGLLLPATGR